MNRISYTATRGNCPINKAFRMKSFRDPSLQDWQQLASWELKGASPDSLTWQTVEGIPVKALYSSADLAELENLGSLPGLRAVRARAQGHHVRRTGLDRAPVRRVLNRGGLQRLLSEESRRRTDRAVGRLRSADPSRL